ncbi:3-hydroxyacyl-CoA dehydrogenase family protein [Saccharopolyspora phatthalungensis]|uniref:3-hydroxybutyryl-CoA dehydrogenase n=1 Tax=Saccharopolyspora phatthalungensis TaxID=664693 RepID=A0A840QJ40_9PSEU|nr:3-hydroxyacyl-CoA dehydrogenase family protein [Saccharopolyspora phatthalungensis]MBB5158755.1 3-hydroxybutyryl-CoA dehydrogenase [Saccharopolyspora phatthalungensis]
MPSKSFPVVGVVGLGAVGSALAAMIARSGRRVLCAEADGYALAEGRARVAQALDQLGTPDAGNLVAYTIAPAAFAQAHLVIEALPENLDLKVDVLRRANACCRPDAVLATTTTGFAVTEIAARCGRVDRTVGLHVGNPGAVAETSVVEVVHTPLTGSSVRHDVAEFVADLGLTTVAVGDNPGFLGGALTLSYLNSAAVMLGQGYATRDDIDSAMTLGCRMPIGPLAHLDALGIDMVVDSLTALAARTGDRGFRPAPVLSSMVGAGLLGRKSGRGFYRYGSDDASAPTPAPRRRGAAIRRIGLLGSGTMATGIAEVCAAAGFPTTLVARTAVRAKEATAAIERSLQRGVRRGRITDDQLAAIVTRFNATTELGAIAACDVVIEAVREDLRAKQDVFAQLDQATRPGTVLATTTSSLPVGRCADATGRPEDVIGLHFFNPAPAMRLVEVTRTPLTSDKTAATALRLVSALGKHPVCCQDRTGFIVNALLFPYLNRAVNMIGQGCATTDELDTIMVGAHGYPMGPLRLLDMIGLDVSLEILERLYDTFGEPELFPAKHLRELVMAGHLGYKTGRGFHVHDPGGPGQR